ncbi:MAG: glycosyltransferase [Bdellovibrionales bacterium]
MALQNVFDWLKAHPDLVARDWLVMGKGPSFARRNQLDISAYAVLALNDTIRDVKATIAHLIDLEVVDRCADALEANAQIVVMPYYPHSECLPGARALPDLVGEYLVLAKLAASGRLLWYDLDTVPQRSGGPVVAARYFSIEAAVHMLALAGVHIIRTLGVDGGTAYSEDFAALNAVSRLQNGHKDYNRQFEGVARVKNEFGLDLLPLDDENPVRVYVAATASEMLPTKVLAYSIQKHASINVEVMPLCDAGIIIPQPQSAANKARTPFSFQRFLIPQLAGRQGRAIYLDSDMLVFKDIREIWFLDMRGANVVAAYADSKSGRKPQFSVMLLDCGKLDWDINKIVADLDSGKLTYERLMYNMELAQVRADIGPYWNSLESYTEDTTALLHFTDMNTQPWVSTRNPHGYLWVRALREAIAKGLITRAYVAEEIEKGHVRPSLLAQLDAGIDDPLLIPRHMKDMDKSFRAPYHSLQGHLSRPWNSPVVYAKAVLRALYQRTPLYPLERKIRRRLNG